jgi:hypothetical protein
LLNILEASTGERKSDIENVHIRTFGMLADTMGWNIMEDGVKKLGILERAYKLTTNYQWFHGLLSSNEAYERLKTEDVGTFLVRFSTTMVSISAYNK